VRRRLGFVERGGSLLDYPADTDAQQLLRSTAGRTQPEEFALELETLNFGLRICSGNDQEVRALAMSYAVAQGAAGNSCPAHGRSRRGVDRAWARGYSACR